MAAKKASAKPKPKASTSKSQDALSEIKTHQRECAIRYEYIEKRLDEGSAKFKRLELILWGLYGLIAASLGVDKLL